MWWIYKPYLLKYNLVNMHWKTKVLHKKILHLQSNINKYKGPQMWSLPINMTGWVFVLLNVPVVKLPYKQIDPWCPLYVIRGIYHWARQSSRSTKKYKKKEKKSFTINIQLKHRSVPNVLGCQLQLHRITVTRKVKMPRGGTDCGVPLEICSGNAAWGGGWGALSTAHPCWLHQK